jgi:hypothetical protein
VPPFKRAAPPTLAPPLALGQPPADGPREAPPALLFDDVAGGPVCDPNDPDCEVV